MSAQPNLDPDRRLAPRCTQEQRAAFSVLAKERELRRRADRAGCSVDEARTLTANGFTYCPRCQAWVPKPRCKLCQSRKRHV